MIGIHEQAGRIDGPAVCDTQGYLLSNAKMNDCFTDLLEAAFESSAHLFPREVEDATNIWEKFTFFAPYGNFQHSEPPLRMLARWTRKLSLAGTPPKIYVQGLLPNPWTLLIQNSLFLTNASVNKGGKGGRVNVLPA